MAIASGSIEPEEAVSAIRSGADGLLDAGFDEGDVREMIVARSRHLAAQDG